MEIFSNPVYGWGNNTYTRLIKSLEEAGMVRPIAPLVIAAVLLAGVSAAQALTTVKAPETEQQRNARVQFEPIDKVAKEGREVRRVVYATMWNDLNLPAVTLEKTKTGEVSMKVTSDQGKTVDIATLKPEAWTYITQNDKAAFSPVKPVKAANVEICHGNSVVLEGASKGKVLKRDAGVCGADADLASMEYGRRIAEVAATSIPRCSGFVESGREFSWILRECLKKTGQKVPRDGSYGRATGAFNEPYKSFAITTANVIRAPLKDEEY